MPKTIWNSSTIPNPNKRTEHRDISSDWWMRDRTVPPEPDSNPVRHKSVRNLSSRCTIPSTDPAGMGNNENNSEVHHPYAGYPDIRMAFAAQRDVNESSPTGRLESLTMEGVELLRTCERCKKLVRKHNFWLLPMCGACGKLFYEKMGQTEQSWLRHARLIRENSLAASTIQRYESIIKRNKWPLEKPTDVLRLLESVSPSDSALKQAQAAAQLVHSTRGWQPIDLGHPLVMGMLKALRRTRMVTPEHNPTINVFTKSELQTLFSFFGEANPSPTAIRDRTILALQLFGTRRASEILQLQ